MSHRSTAQLLSFAALVLVAAGMPGCSNWSSIFPPSLASSKIFDPVSPLTVLHAAAPKPSTRVKLKAKFDGGFALPRIPGLSTGTYVAHMTVAIPSEAKHDGAGRALMRVVIDPNGLGFTTVGIRAAYDPAIHGFVVRAESALTPIGSPQSFPNVAELDLRIEQTATHRTFHARPTPNPPTSDSGFTLVLDQTSAVTALPFTIGAGIEGVPKSATYFLNNFALDGPTIGGVVEGPIVADVRAAIDSLVAAAAELALPVPSLPTAAAALDSAETSLASARTSLNAAITGATLQETTLGASALKTLDLAIAARTKVETVVAGGDPKKAKAKAKATDAIVSQCVIVVANLMGQKLTNAKNARAVALLHAPGL